MLENLDLQACGDELARCNRCGFCQAVCPTYQVTGSEPGVARGRNMLCEALANNRLTDDPSTDRTLAECLLCGACVTACFPAVKTHDLVVRGRHRYKQSHGHGMLERFALHALLPNPNRLGRLARTLSVGKRSGVSGAVQVFRRLGTFGKHLATAEAFVDRVPTQFLRSQLTPADLQPSRRVMRVAYFIGCGINFALPAAGLATVRVLRALGCELVVTDHVCCGLPAYAYGDFDAALDLARRNLDRFRHLDVDAIVTDCSSCASFLKDYGTLLGGDEPGAEAAAGLSRKVMDVTELLGTLSSDAELRSTPQKVTYHRPCHQIRYQRLAVEPIRVIESAPGASYVKLREDDWCCGGSGSYSIAHQELSMKVLDRKMQNIEATGADVVASCCPSCLLQLSYGVRQRRLPIQVRHLSELLAERLPMPSP